MNWKRALVVFGLTTIMSSCLFSSGYAGEKEELQLKARALIAEANLAQSNIQLWQLKLNEAQKVIQEFVKELDQKGYVATQDGNIVEKPKPQPKEEVPKKTPTPK